MTDKLQEAVNAKGGVVTLKLKRLVAARQALALLMGTALPPALSLRLSRLSRAANAELEEYDRLRGQLLKRYGETKDGQNFTFPDAGKREEYDREMEGMGAEEITLPAVTLTLKDLGEREFPPALFEQLDWLFPEVEEETAREEQGQAAAG